MRTSSTSRSRVISVVAPVLLAPLLIAAPGVSSAASPTQSACSAPVLVPTLVGTAADDHLVGTAGRDVIDAGAGNDVVRGLSGNDVLLGSAGNDLLLGGEGRDTVDGGSGQDIVIGDRGADLLCGAHDADVLIGGAGDDDLAGGNDGDVVSAGFGDDQVRGENGDDVLAGGPGADAVVAGRGADRANGVHGDDLLSGGEGADHLLGGEGDDSADGGLGADACEAETGSCERTAAPRAVVAELGQAAQDAATLTYRLDWSGSAEGGLRLVELYANDTLVAHQVIQGTSAEGTFDVSPSDLPPGDLALYSVVTDGDGTQVGSEAVQLLAGSRLEPLPALAALELDPPLPIDELVAMLDEQGLLAMEYTAHDVPAPAPVPDPELLRAVADAGRQAFVPEEMQVVYSPRGTDPRVHGAQLRSYYARQGISGEPLIDSVLLLGPVADGDLGALAAHATISGNAPRREPAPTPERTEPAEPAAAFSMEARRAPEPVKSGFTQEDDGDLPALSDGADVARSSLMAATAVAPTEAYWPSFGRFDVDTYDTEKWTIRCRVLPVLGPICGPARVTQPKAELQHQLVFLPEVIESFGTRDAAYEHGVKVRNEDRSLTRPFCNPFTEDDFYIRTQTAEFTTSNVPGAAQLYNDSAIFDDACSSNEVTFGVAIPEKLDDGAPSDQLPVFVVEQESDRDDDEDRWFSLSTQTLSRDTAGCDHLPASLKKLCIGIDVGQSRSRPLAQSGGVQLPGLELPTCTTWTWTDLGNEQGPDRVSRCGGDRDGDGFDDTIDCDPDDPLINPGAVDVPNDGIDQNCDGRDLTVGDGEIRVTLIWDNADDLDLHLTEPNGRRIWYASPGPTSYGGRLDRDDNVGMCGRDPEPGGVENIYYSDASSPQRGRYSVQVVQYSTCGPAANWRAEVRIDGQLLMTANGQRSGGFTFLY